MADTTSDLWEKMNKLTVGECFFQIRNGANIKQGVADGGFPITRIETIANDRFNRDRMGYVIFYLTYFAKCFTIRYDDLISIPYIHSIILSVR